MTRAGWRWRNHWHLGFSVGRRVGEEGLPRLGRGREFPVDQVRSCREEGWGVRVQAGPRVPEDGLSVHLDDNRELRSGPRKEAEGLKLQRSPRSGWVRPGRRDRQPASLTCGRHWQRRGHRSRARRGAEKLAGRLDGGWPVTRTTGLYRNKVRTDIIPCFRSRLRTSSRLDTARRTTTVGVGGRSRGGAAPIPAPPY